MTRSISAIVVTYNSAHCVGACLRSLSRLAPDETVVVDNASADGTLEVVREASPGAVVVETGQNLGFGRACNVAAGRAAGDVLLFVNPDVVVTRVDRSELDRDIDPEPLGLVVPLLAGATGAQPQHPLFRHRRPGRWILGEAWEPLRPRELQRPTRPASAGGDVWAAGTLFFVRRDEFVAAGGFDPRFFLYAEDVDLSRRYRARGLPIRTTRALNGEHAGAASSSETDDGPVRVAPIAWSLLGAIEYVSIWHGAGAARRAAATALRSLRAERALLRALRRVRIGSRAARKEQQVGEIERFLVAHAATAGDYCPGARDALRSALGGS